MMLSAKALKRPGNFEVEMSDFKKWLAEYKEAYMHEDRIIGKTLLVITGALAVLDIVFLICALMWHPGR